jgi:hypothetical protein
MLQRNRIVGLIEPCLPSPAKAPPTGPDWLHEIKGGEAAPAGRLVNGAFLFIDNFHQSLLFGHFCLHKVWLSESLFALTFWPDQILFRSFERNRVGPIRRGGRPRR